MYTPSYKHRSRKSKNSEQFIQTATFLHINDDVHKSGCVFLMPSINFNMDNVAKHTKTRRIIMGNRKCVKQMICCQLSIVDDDGLVVK